MKKEILRAPSIVIPESVEVPAARRTSASNGVRIDVINCSESSVVRISFVFHAGTSWQHKPFCASATVNNMSEGGEHLSSLEIAERLDFYGSYFDVSVDRDYSVVTFCCLSKFFDRTMELIDEIMLHPAFPEQEVATYCSKRRQQLDVDRSKIGFISREEFASALFGKDHPYGVSSPSSAYADVCREDLLAFYREFYTAGNCFVVMSGDVTDNQTTAMKELVERMPLGAKIPERLFPEPQREQFRKVPFNGAVQSSIRIGRMMFPRSHADFIPMQVVTTLLGGYFGSRLVQNLRERHGYTYGAYSAMINFDRAGYLAIATDVASQVTDAAVGEIFGEMERLQNDRVAAEELDMVKNIMLGEVMRILDGPFGIADVTIENIQNGFGNDYTETFVERVRAVTPDDILCMSQRYFRKEDFTTVIVG